MYQKSRKVVGPMDNYSIKSVTFGEGSSVTTIPENAFNGCENLQSIRLPQNLVSIDPQAFAFSGLTSIELPQGLVTISYEAFSSNWSLTSITIPDSVTTIEWNAFYGCSSLASVTVLATTPPTFDSSALESCSNLTTITVPAGTGDAYKAAEGWSSYASKIVEATN